MAFYLPNSPIPSHIWQSSRAPSYTPTHVHTDVYINTHTHAHTHTHTHAHTHTCTHTHTHTHARTHAHAHTNTHTQMLIFHGFIKIFRCNFQKLFQVIMKAYNDSVILWECFDRFTTLLFYYNLSSSDSSHTTSVYSTISVYHHYDFICVISQCMQGQ